MPKQSPINFDAPVPGMSLTTEPGNRPWENPPQFAEIEEVLDYYIDRLSDESRQDDMLAIIEEGMPINMLVDSTISTGVMSGLHTVEAGLLAAPVLAEFMQAMADIEGINYTLSTADKKKGLSPAMQRKAEKMIQQELQAELEGNAMPQEEEVLEEPMMDEEQEPKRGLMARPVAMLAEVTEVEVEPMEGEEQA
jgi:hypothetical protein